MVQIRLRSFLLIAPSTRIVLATLSESTLLRPTLVTFFSPTSAIVLTHFALFFQWRRFQYRRIDGTTSLDDREDAIVDFNRPDSEVFIFLLSIRAAGRGLNLQTADTVVVYDPDPNPKNEVWPCESRHV